MMGILSYQTRQGYHHFLSEAQKNHSTYFTVSSELSIFLFCLSTQVIVCIWEFYPGLVGEVSWRGVATTP